MLFSYCKRSIGVLLWLYPVVVIAQQHTTQVATSTTHTASIHADGTLWTWGENREGQLGDGTTIDRLTPIQVGTDSTWVRVATGYAFTLAVRRDGSLWSWGQNYRGQLGNGTRSTSTAQVTAPTQVGTDQTWASVAAGESYSLALRRDGTLWAWGDNQDGQLGDGTATLRTTPVRVLGAAPWRSVTAGPHHALAIRQDGTLWSWGFNSSGQLGLGTSTNRWYGEAPSPVPQQVGTAHTWQTVTASTTQTLATRQDGTLWTWGEGYFGPAGARATSTPPRPLGPTGVPMRYAVADRGTTIALACDGSLWGWGSNHRGQLGNGTEKQQDDPVLLSPATRWSQIVLKGDHAVAVRADGSVWAWGGNTYGEVGHASLTAAGTREPRQAGAHTTWKAVSIGVFHAVALQQDGSFWAWGQNAVGEAGDGTTGNRRVPAVVSWGREWSHLVAGQYYTMGLRHDGTLWGWGRNAEGQLGDGTRTPRTSPQRIGTATNWASVAPGSHHTAAIRRDGTLWTWGENTGGELGRAGLTSSLLPQQVGTATTWRQVAVGQHHTVAVRTDGTLWAWGQNQMGQLGDGTYHNQAVPVQIGTDQDWVSVGAGDRHTLAIRRDGSLWTWGDNTCGQVGLEPWSRNTPVPTRMGSATDWVSAAGNFVSSVGLRQDGSLWTWGWAFSSTWTRAETHSFVPREVVPGQRWQSFATSWTQLVAIRADGTLWGWGSNYTGVLGTPSYTLEPLLIQPGTGATQRGESLTVYPNPAHGTATVRSTTCGVPLYLFDMTGRQLRRLPSCTATLDLHGLAAGVYVLQQGPAYTRVVVE